MHAASSVLAARRLAGLETAAGTPGPGNRARALLAADVYRALPADERAAIAIAIAANPRTVWLGDPGEPDEPAVLHSAYAADLAADLAAVLAERDHLTEGTSAAPHACGMDAREPAEAAFARRAGAPAPRHRPLVLPSAGSPLSSVSGVRDYRQTGAAPVR
jgi:hypothetical protein